MVRKIASTIAALALLTIASAAYAGPTSTYYGPHQGTIEGAVAGSYANSDGISDYTIDLGATVYATNQVFWDASLGYTGENQSGVTGDIFTYGIGVGYDLTSNNNVVPYVGVGFAGTTVSASESGVGSGSLSGSAIGAKVGVSDYFIKGRAIYIEEDGDFDNGASAYTTILGLKMAIN